MKKNKKLQEKKVHKLMTEEEKADITMKSFEMEGAGLKNEALLLRRTIPLSPYMAKILKESIGAEFLINGGYNLAEAEVAYGPNWLAG